MQKMFFSGLKIHIDTDNGEFGQCLKFEKGLNIIRAENTSGKTTILSSIIYALGCEALLSAKQGNAVLKSVLKESIAYEKKSYKVIESYILLELTNEKNEAITLKRFIVGSQNYNLVSVYTNKLITETSGQIEKEDYYLNSDGAAQREKGFHKFIQSFIGIDLPYVPKYNEDKTVPLYIQTILPLMFIEQIRGWSGIQATIPKIYGIEGVNNIAFEYVLKLDVMSNRLKKKEIKKEIEKNKTQWKNIKDGMEDLAEDMKCFISVFPSITTDLKKEDHPNFIFRYEDKDIHLEDYIVALREKLEIVKSETTVKIENNKIQNKIDTLQNDIVVLSSKLKENTIELLSENNDLKKYDFQIKNLSTDIRQHKDIRKIIRLGSDEKLSIAENKCPTCKTHLKDSLIQEIYTPMSLEDNIKYLETQMKAMDILIKSTANKIEKLNTVEHSIKQLVKEKRDLLQSFTKDIFSGSNISEGLIREKINLENNIIRLESLFVKHTEIIDNLLSISKLYKQNKGNLEELPKDDFSKKDKEKLTKFNELFSDLLQKYGYSSTKIYNIKITTKNYQPFFDGFDLTLESSASDNIRIIWAYSVALLYMTHLYETNHFGFVVFDEPEQQRMKEASSKELYISLASAKISNMQSIVATSEDSALLKSKIENIKCNVLELNNKAIVPKRFWLYNN